MKIIRFHESAMSSENTDYHYRIELVWSEADQTFLAKVPELPGCIADGDTYEGAIANVRVVIGLWIETALTLGREVPQPQIEKASAVV